MKRAAKSTVTPVVDTAMPSWARSASNPSGLNFTLIPDSYYDIVIPALVRAKHRKAALFLGVIIHDSCRVKGIAEWITLPVAEFAERCGASKHVMAIALDVLVRAGFLESRQSNPAIKSLRDYRVGFERFENPNIPAVSGTAALVGGVQ